MAFIGDEPENPYAFIQWKGTDVCMDFHCECGAHCHFDGSYVLDDRRPIKKCRPTGRR